MERILARDNMLLAWKRVKANKGASGIDGMTIEEAPGYIRQHWEDMRSSLEKGTYMPKAVRRVEIPKPTGGKRPLGIPTVMDRLIQQAIAQVLGPLFDPTFSEYSYGFRPQRSAHQAIREVQKAAQEGYTIAVDTDLSKFFDTVNHDDLLRLVGARVKDRRVMRLIARYLHAGVMLSGRVEPTTEGVPQGGPLSPLLANIVLHELDKELERRGHRFARYADDFIIMVKSISAGQRVFANIKRFIGKHLHLHVNETKSKVAPLGECRFLGFRIHRKRICWDPGAEREFKRRIRELTSRSWGVSMEVRLHKLAEYMRGWCNYFGISEYYTPIPKLDHWIHRRVRLCYWKMWKKPRKRMAELMKLGTGRLQAVTTGRSRKGCWRLSRTLATQTGMTSAWLAKQGLLSLKELWVAIHYPQPG
jgi:RNA-directed DNA polymerase